MEKFSLGQLVMTRGVHSKIKEDVDFAVGIVLNKKIGDLVNVKVTKAYSWHLFGEVINEEN